MNAQDMIDDAYKRANRIITGRERAADVESALKAILQGIEAQRADDPWWRACEDLKRAEEHARWVLNRED